MKTIAGIAAALALAGCVTGGPMTHYHVSEPYVFFSYAASRGAIPVMVVGDPYPGRRPQVESVVADALDRNFRFLGNPFRTVPPAPGEGTKVVVIFNGPDSTIVAGACDDPTRMGSGPSGPRTTARALYCGVGPYSEYWMSFPTPASPEDPAFREHMASLIYFGIPREPEPSKRLGDSPPP